LASGQQPGRPRDRLRRQIEEERVVLARMAALLGVEGDTQDLYDAVARLKPERAELGRRLAQMEAEAPDEA
jgi:hypothetical protein